MGKKEKTPELSHSEAPVQPSKNHPSAKASKAAVGSKILSPSPPTKLTFDYRYFVAPMVGAAELPFRIICRKYGAQLAYTPMMSAAQFATDAD